MLTPLSKLVRKLMIDHEIRGYKALADKLGWSKARVVNLLNGAPAIYGDDINDLCVTFTKTPRQDFKEAVSLNLEQCVLKLASKDEALLLIELAERLHDLTPEQIGHIIELLKKPAGLSSPCDT